MSKNNIPDDWYHLLGFDINAYNAQKEQELITKEQKAYLQSIGCYHKDITQEEMNDIANAFSGNLAGTKQYNVGYYSGPVLGNVKHATNIQEFSKQPVPGIYYKKMSLFDAPKNSILCHACNAQGVWNSGIAKEFKSKFPKAFEEYNKYCTMNLPYHTVGNTFLTVEENHHTIGCLITSSDFGARLSIEKLILTNTKNALEKLAQANSSSVYYSNKFNSGFFKVPWEKTEEIIKDFCKKYNKVWVVMDPDLQEKV